MWIDPNRTVAFAHLTVEMPASGIAGTFSSPNAPAIVPIAPSMFNLPATARRIAELESPRAIGEQVEEDDDGNEMEKDTKD